MSASPKQNDHSRFSASFIDELAWLAEWKWKDEDIQAAVGKAMVTTFWIVLIVNMWDRAYLNFDANVVVGIIVFWSFYGSGYGTRPIA